MAKAFDMVHWFESQSLNQAMEQTKPEWCVDWGSTSLYYPKSMFAEKNTSERTKGSHSFNLENDHGSCPSQTPGCPNMSQMDESSAGQPLVALVKQKGIKEPPLLDIGA